MLLHPSIQARAQAEVDSVTGGDRLPTYADREKLEYVEALCWELVRWMPVAPLGAYLLFCSM